MTKEVYDILMAAMDEKIEEVKGNPEAARKWLIRIGAETEESLRKHDEMLARRAKRARRKEK